MNELFLYHWTHRRNLPDILPVGLLASYSHTARPEVWACSAARVGWALAHIAGRHGWDADDMVLIRIRADRCEWVRTAFSGVYVTRGNVSPDHFRGVKDGVLGAFKPVVGSRRVSRKGA